MRRPADVRLRLRASGAAPAVEVWDRYARTARWSTWSPQVRAVDLPARIAPGARGAVHGPAGLRADGAFDEEATQLLQSFAAGASSAVAGSRLRWHKLRRTGGLEEALASATGTRAP